MGDVGWFVDSVCLFLRGLPNHVKDSRNESKMKSAIALQESMQEREGFNMERSLSMKKGRSRESKAQKVWEYVHSKINQSKPMAILPPQM